MSGTDDLSATPAVEPGRAASSRAEAEAPQVGTLSLEDLARLDRELDGVDAALVRLADRTYWSDEITGEPLPDELLTSDPIARRA